MLYLVALFVLGLKPFCCECYCIESLNLNAYNLLMICSHLLNAHNNNIISINNVVMPQNFNLGRLVIKIFINLFILHKF